MSTPRAHNPSPKGCKKKRGGRVTAAAIKEAERTDTALGLRRKGYSYREIAKEMKLPVAEVHGLVKCAFDEAIKCNLEGAAEQLEMELQRLDVMYKAILPKIDADRPEYLARNIEVALKISERRARLLGLDAPAKTELKVAYSELTDQELLQEAEKLRIPVDVKLLGVNVDGAQGSQSLLLPGETPESVPAALLPQPEPPASPPTL